VVVYYGQGFLNYRSSPTFLATFTAVKFMHIFLQKWIRLHLGTDSPGHPVGTCRSLKSATQNCKQEHAFAMYVFEQSLKFVNFLNGLQQCAKKYPAKCMLCSTQNIERQLCYSYRSVPLLGWGLTSAFYG
jgi:hypothetical protein